MMPAIEFVTVFGFVGLVLIAFFTVMHRLIEGPDKGPFDLSKFVKRGTISCANCGSSYRLMNGFGFCGKCWSELSDEQLRRLGIAIDEKARTITIYKPWPNGWLILILSTAASILFSCFVPFFWHMK